MTNARVVALKFARDQKQTDKLTKDSERKVTIELTKSQAHSISDLINFVFDDNGGASNEDIELLNVALVANFVRHFGDEFKRYYYNKDM